MFYVTILRGNSKALEWLCFANCNICNCYNNLSSTEKTAISICIDTFKNTRVSSFDANLRSCFMGPYRWQPCINGCRARYHNELAQKKVSSTTAANVLLAMQVVTKKLVNVENIVDILVEYIVI